MAASAWIDTVFNKRIAALEGVKKKIGSTVFLTGWALRYRDQGGLIFVDLRDRSGLIQLVFDRSVCGDSFDIATTIRNEFVLAVEGTVRHRGKDAVNPKLATGTVEVLVRQFEILNESRTVPFELDEYGQVGEEQRLRFRYLDLRRDEMREALILRSRFNQSIRRHLEKSGFLEIETPVLNKSTPEGARDFLVPSRLSPGSFYALPQSPQIFKQLLMIGGLERYFQIVKCFRDEDLRADRQLEFTQLDMEYSFVNEEILLSSIEKLWQGVFKEVLGIELKTPFPRIPYNQAMEDYGSDRPDIRFEMKLRNVEDIVQQSEFKVFREAIEKGGMVRALPVPGGARLSRKDIDDLTSWVNQDFGARGLAWIKHEEGGLKSVIGKFFSDGLLEKMVERCGTRVGDIIFFAADRPDIVYAVLGNLRVHLGAKFEQIPADQWSLSWVNDFPLFERDPESGSLTSVHHPFTAPHPEDAEILADPARLAAEGTRIRSRAYDLVMNGVEIGGGSIRIHRPEMQQQIFDALGIGPEEAQEKFGFLLQALGYGAPPHGGIAFGLDRMLALLLKRESIRDVIAFPKTQKGACLMSGTPSPVDPLQLRELKIRLATVGKN